MKRVLLLTVAAALLLPFASFAASGEAHVRLYGLSLRFQPATARSLGLNYTLTLTTDSPANVPGNGELSPLPAGALTSHGSFYRIEGDILFEPAFGTLALNVPGSDSNTNGIPDLFEVGLTISSTSTTGSFSDQYFSGTATAVWSREANSKDGVCRLTLDAYQLTFNHTFEIQQYAGVLRYVSHETNVTGFVTLSKQGESSKSLAGPVVLDKISPDRLGLHSGTWTNETRQAFAFASADQLDRAGNRYADLLVFQDGDPSTALDDYAIWILTITDLNDANRNGLPDISDEVIAGQPVLNLSRAGANLLLSVGGQIGKRHDVERALAVPSTNWISVASLILTNDPQTISLQFPTNATSFWRVRVP